MARRFTHLPDLPTYQRDTEQIQQIHPYRMAASPHPDGLRKGSFVQDRPLRASRKQALGRLVGRHPSLLGPPGFSKVRARDSLSSSSL